MIPTEKKDYASQTLENLDETIGTLNKQIDRLEKNYEILTIYNQNEVEKNATKVHDLEDAIAAKNKTIAHLQEQIT